MRTKLTLAALGAILAGTLVLGAGAAEAQERFQLERTDEGFVRLDTQTGAISTCRDQNGELTCRMAPDERAAYETELDLLEKRVTALEERLSQTPPDRMPSDAEVDRSLSIMERFMRTFMGIVREFTGGPNPEPQPDRT
ncbi:hypothetical protein N7E02_18450 [Aliirhizobium terrae]|uniref:hypothetical protein n=1 Tax=Terrirhizobium terrae TaxID=2926709 RepID=UPI002575468C|nr:hypothetical protein [Rhizobium sp. CC-CFT758]WJH38916.1 hypothetical protein N7E02_18450 [Rhizobium sp. CC-CFT758]